MVSTVKNGNDRLRKGNQRRRDRLLQEIVSRDMRKSWSLRSVARIQTGLNSYMSILVAAGVQKTRLVAATERLKSTLFVSSNGSRSLFKLG